MKDYTGPRRMAHRGVGQVAPENTLEALQAAAQMGLEGIEIDVRLTKDGQVAIAHDATMERLTAGSPDGVCREAVCDLTAEEFCALRIPYANHLLDNWQEGGITDECKAIDQIRQLGQDPAYPYSEALAADARDTHPILLKTLLDWLVDAKQEKLLVEIECKSAGLAEACAHVLGTFPMRENCILFSGEKPYIEELQEYERAVGFPQGVKLGANIRWLDEEWRRRVPEMALFEVGLNDTHLDAESVAWLAERNISVFSNLGDYPQAWENVCKLDIAGFKTNYSAEFTRWWQSQKR